MNSLELFNQLYALEKERNYSISLMDFYQSRIKKYLSDDAIILDLGSGSKSLFEEDLGLDKAKITAVDYSLVAIEKARGNSHVNYLEVDITTEKSLGVDHYDLVFDSHCLHCIVDKDKRKSALNNIFNSLKVDGIASFEMMVSSPSDSISFPGKFVVDAIELEQEFLSHGFKIIYFVIVRDQVFEYENDKCDLVRVIVRK